MPTVISCEKPDEVYLAEQHECVKQEVLDKFVEKYNTKWDALEGKVKKNSNKGTKKKGGKS